MRSAIFITCLAGMTLLAGCASWYGRNQAFNGAVSEGRFEKAEKILQKDRRLARGRNRILHLMNQGYVRFMLGKHTESNAALEEAERMAEDQGRDLFTEAAVLVSNPEIRPYRPEDFERIMINFYKTLNYLALQDMEGALVEVRKINLCLQALNDSYGRHRNRYSRDAFAHLLMGLVYDASGDANNAFIAYRNALETYDSLYAGQFGVEAPLQLKKDLIRTAHACGMTAEAQQYERLFGLEHEPRKAGKEAVLFWLNGLAPVKTEWGLDFTKTDKGGGLLVFHNEELGLSFPFFWDSSSGSSTSLADLNIVRVVFPKYRERPLTYTAGEAVCNGRSYPLEPAEDINSIAFKTLRDRMVRELSSSLLRVAAKQGLRHLAAGQNEWLGFAIGLGNALTEKADTRHWQTLPHTISYARIPLEGQEVELRLTSPQQGAASDTLYMPEEGPRTRFSVYTTF